MPCSASEPPTDPFVLALCAVAGPPVLSATQRCAADLMPAIGFGTARRVPRLGAKPSDAELKETISALQRTTSRVPGSSGAIPGASGHVKPGLLLSFVMAVRSQGVEVTLHCHFRDAVVMPFCTAAHLAASTCVSRLQQWWLPCGVLMSQICLGSVPMLRHLL